MFPRASRKRIFIQRNGFGLSTVHPLVHLDRPSSSSYYCLFSYNRQRESYRINLTSFLEDFTNYLLLASALHILFPATRKCSYKEYSVANGIFWLDIVYMDRASHITIVLSDIVGMRYCEFVPFGFTFQMTSQLAF